MEQVTIDHKPGEPFYCPFCGTRTIPTIEESEKGFHFCGHLLYIGTTEGGFEYLCPDIENKVDEETNEDELAEMLINNAIHFSLCAPPPSGFGAYVGYKK